jgi:uncharacterized membrane protein
MHGENVMSEPKRTRLVFLGFADDTAAENALELVEDAIKDREIVVEDWALLQKAADGKVTVRKNKNADPNAARGGVFGGAAGALLAVLSGPIGVGAVAAGAAIGAVTAAHKDSGIKDEEIKEVAKFMADGRTGLMLAVPLDQADKYDTFAARFENQATKPDRQYQVDIVPGRDFERALSEYRAHEED